MKKLSVLVVLCFSLMACGPSLLYLKPERTISNPYLSFQSPDKAWYVFAKKWYKKEFIWRVTEGDAYRKHIHKDIPNTELTILVENEKDISTTSAEYYNPDTDFNTIYYPYYESEEGKQADKAGGYFYRKYQEQYVHGMKCSGRVIARDYTPITPPMFYNKTYRLLCGYYLTSGERRLLVLTYEYSLNNKFWDISREVIRQEGKNANAILLEDFAKLVNTLELKNVDWARMRKEGLIHDKPFASMIW